MNDHAARRATLVRLIGRQADQSWRRALIAEGLVVPTGGVRHVSLVDLTGSTDPQTELARAIDAAGTEPVVAVSGLGDPLPTERRPNVHVVRLDQPRVGPVVRAIRTAAQSRVLADASALRVKALAAMGRSFPAIRPEGAEGPAALLSEPAPAVLSLLSGTGWHDLVAPLTSSQTLRLLENHQASALIINLTSEQDHRLPVLKLIRRQSELSALPVAVVAETWDAEKAAPWFNAGADFLATPDELPALLIRLRTAAERFVTDRTARLALTCSSLTDRGEPSPIMGCELFDRLALEHGMQGDELAFGAVKLEAEPHGGEADLSEAGVYMAMALAPMDFVCRPRPDLFIVGMPYADKFYAGRMMRTLQTLIEDLKFGQEPEVVLIAARTTFIERAGETVAEVRQRLASDLSGRGSSLLLA